MGNLTDIFWEGPKLFGIKFCPLEWIIKIFLILIRSIVLNYCFSTLFLFIALQVKVLPNLLFWTTDALVAAFSCFFEKLLIFSILLMWNPSPTSHLSLENSHRRYLCVSFFWIHPIHSHLLFHSGFDHGRQSFHYLSWAERRIQPNQHSREQK